MLAVLAAWSLPIADGADRADPRSLREQSFRLTATLSPLVELRPQLTGPQTALFRVTVTNLDGGGYRPDRVRTASLDRFDGALWTGPGDFQVAGSTLPGFEAPEAPAQRVRLDVEVDRLDQPFLPLVGEPAELVGALDPRSGVDTRGGFAFDRPTGTAVRTAGAAGPFRYSAVGAVAPLDAATRQAVPSRAPADVPFTELPSFPPPWVGQVADLAVQDRQTAMSQLLAIEDMLRKQDYRADALPGHSYGALKRVLLGVPADRVGNAEQFAAAFAVLARSKGFPARVAVGYQLRQEQREGETYTVDSTDAHAWPEVHLQGYGWVPFEPTDARSPAAPQPPRSPDVTLGAADRDLPVLAGPGPREDATPAEVASRIGTGAAALGGLVALLAVLVVVAKALRRRGRARRGPPAQRVVAAWAELVDHLREAGVRVPAAHTASEVAGDARRTPPAAAAAASIEAMAPLVSAAIYAPGEPGEQDAARAWALAAQARTQVNRSLGLGVRLRALVDPRSLLPARLRSRRDRSGGPRRAPVPPTPGRRPQ